MSRHASALWLGTVLCSLSAAVAVAAPPIPLGAEILVNKYTTNNQLQPSVAADGTGAFVVAWTSKGQDGSLYGVFAHRFDSAGSPQATEFIVNSFTTNYQFNAAVARHQAVGFVIAWASKQDGSQYGIFARRFDSTGSPLAGELQVNTFTSGFQNNPDLGFAASGSFVVVWDSQQDGAGKGTFGRRFNAAGVPVAAEFQINLVTEGDQNYPQVAVRADGSFVVAWTSGPLGGDLDIFARRFDSAGVGASEFRVNTFTSDTQSYPDLAIDGDGAFVVVWESVGEDGDGFGITARRFDSIGAPLSASFAVNQLATSNQRKPSIAMGTTGDFVVTWDSTDQDGSGYGVFARPFDASGVPSDDEFQVSTYTLYSQSSASVAAGGNAEFVVAWAASGDANQPDIIARRFLVTAVLDIDASGSVGALTDGLLVVRFLFGFTGSTLTSGAVADDCTRCNAAAIEPYLLGLV